MKKTLINLGGVILFYILIVIGVIILNLRFTEINKNLDSKLVVINN